MPETIINAGSPIKDFVKSTKDQILEGLEGLELKTPIEMELNVIINGKLGAGLDISVVNFGAKVEATQTQKIKFSIGQKSDVEEAEKLARIEKAKTEEELAKRKRNFNVTIV